tara:strand:- start:189 stop:788 length:600 start_codon:yes stop_codon:yes gene_type:complete
MDNSAKQRFGELLTLVAAARSHNLSKIELQAYWIGIADEITIEEMERAAIAAIKRCKFFPSVAELLELAGVSPERATTDAWGIVLSAIPIGPYKSVDFSDAAINATIRTLGGWPMFVSRFSDADSEKWARLEFTKVYGSLSASSVDGEASRPLAGLSESQIVNGIIGPPIPIQIGCHRRTPVIERRQSVDVPAITLRRA